MEYSTLVDGALWRRLSSPRQNISVIGWDRVQQGRGSVSRKTCAPRVGSKESPYQGVAELHVRNKARGEHVTLVILARHQFGRPDLSTLSTTWTYEREGEVREIEPRRKVAEESTF